MSKKANMNVFLHFLLVIKQMNNFTVTQAKETLLREQSEFTDPVETRKFVYRQLTRNVAKGLLKRTNKLRKGVKEVIYSKTELFFSLEVVPSSRASRLKKISTENIGAPDISAETVKVIEYQEELKKDLLTYEIDLNTVLEEAKEYQRLSARYPKLQEKLQLHHTQAKEKSIKLLGKINALQTLLGNKITEKQPC
ncbi:MULTISPECIES: hypothetical protein [unclassified Pseudoalteromonas]|jgi:hypothetical protein|uniref:hypothetical protein n=1 Tax=unclassified Pseudoalteromonas TaxID=194690 RepID=UPI0023581FFE|nr:MULTISPECIES: hypothetical protein [unclassified Pseudoalteromonas]MDC9499649.1 hypothetical protein [Pseudoalteromonas sp. Angola-20]MDC9519269.1 hypothetical protein [Pseudoalteromonas sp. Angola-22]MDC9535676.1 hypothetical protein [Pseudoalteromonas sp. Angola-9]|tara:strand:- start:7513 stop:8097 length:585 start_codon:yes stop_codon:yes gene_type:complete